MKKVLAILMAAMLTVGLSFSVFADPDPLQDMYFDVPFQNWVGAYVNQSISGSNLTIMQSSSYSGLDLETRKAMAYSRGLYTNVFSMNANAFVVDSQLCAGGSFNFSFIYSLHGSENNPDAAWVRVLDLFRKQEFPFYHSYHKL